MDAILSFFLGGFLGVVSHYIEKHWVKKYETLKGKGNLVIEIGLWGLLFIGITLRFGMHRDAIKQMLLLSILMFLAVFDFKYMILPTKAIYFGLGLNIIIAIMEVMISGSSQPFISSLLGCVVGYALFVGIFYGSKWILKKEGLGFGDVRLMAFIGWLVGIEGLFLTIILASLLAVFVGGLLYMIRRKSEAFPFGPFLCSGAALMSLYGPSILKCYLRWIGIW